MDVIELLGEAEGTYLGSGTDHDGTEFHGELQIERAVDGAGISLMYTARDDRGRPIRQEQMLVGYTRDGTLYLWGLDSATERIRQHSLVEAAETTGGARLRFGTIGPADERTLREEITFEFQGEDVEIEFARGQAGESFDVHSTVELVPKIFYSLREESETDAFAYREFEEPPDEELRRAIREAAHRLFGSDIDLAIGGDSSWPSDCERHLAVAQVDNSVVGFRILREESAERAVVEWTGVIPEMRDRNVGSELLVRQLEWARRHDYDAVRSEVPADEQWRLVTLLEERFEIVGTFAESTDRTLVVLRYDLREEAS